MTFEIHETILSQPENGDVRPSPEDEERIDFERYADLDNQLRTLRELANSGLEGAVESLERDGPGMQAELDRIIQKYSDRIHDSTEPF